MVQDLRLFIQRQKGLLKSDATNFGKQIGTKRQFQRREDTRIFSSGGIFKKV